MVIPRFGQIRQELLLVPPASLQVTKWSGLRQFRVTKPVKILFHNRAVLAGFLRSASQLLVCVTAMVGSMVLTGCQHFHPEPLSAEDTASALESRSLADPGLKTFLEQNLGKDLDQWPLRQWDFERFTLAAFYFHPSLDVARAQWGVAQAAIVTAGGRPNPVVSITPEYNFNSPAGVSPWLPAVKVDLPIETAGKRGHRVTRAKELSESARLNIATTAWQVRSRLRLSLLEWSSAQQHEALLRQQLAVAEKIATQLEQRFRAGAISSFELASARIALAKVQVDLEDFRRRTTEALARVAEAIGVPARALAETSIKFDWNLASNAEPTSSEMRRDALHTRPDILAALAEYAASQSALQLELAKQYPDVQLGTGYQWDQGENKWALGVSMELPVLNRNEGPIAEAEARRTEAAARFEAIQAGALGQIDRANANYRSAEGNLATVEKLLAAQKKQQEAIAAQFKAGAADQLEQLNAQAELLAIEVLRLDTSARTMDALGQLEDAMQRPFDALSSIEQNPRMTSQNRNP